MIYWEDEGQGTGFQLFTMPLLAARRGVSYLTSLVTSAVKCG